jgi:DNA-binding Lrp family transcriptional regulator
MKARVTLDLKSGSVEESQKTLRDIMERLVTDGVIEGYGFEIETSEGVVTDRCVISGGKVVA